MNQQIYNFKMAYTSNEKLAEIYYLLEQIDFETAHVKKYPTEILNEKVSASRGNIIKIKQILKENVDKIPNNIEKPLSELINLLKLIPEETPFNDEDTILKLEEINLKSSELLRQFIDR